MTLLDLAKRCGETIQVVAQAIEDEFKDKISLSSNTHVPDKYVGTIITKFRGPLSSSAQSKPLVPKKSSVSAAQTYGEESGGVTYRLATLAKDLNVSISSIVEHFDHIFQGNANPNSRVNEDLAKSIIRYFGKEYLIHVPSTTKKPKKNKTQKKKDSFNEKQSDSDTDVQEIKIQKTKLTGKALLKHLRSAVNKRILTGTIVNYDRSRDAYFVEVLGFKSLLYSSEVNTDRKLDSGEEIEVVPLKVDGHKVVEYMTVSMRRAWEIANNKQSKRPSKQQLELEFDQLEIGSEITGRVSRVEDNYVIVEYNNLHGIIYKKDLFWSRVCRIDFYWKVNAPIRAKVISKEVIDGKRQIRFSHKDCIPNIWETLDLDITENGFNETEEASVVEVNDSGIIISLAYDWEGFLPISELSYEEFLFFQKDYSENDLVAVFIKDFDPKKKSLILTRQPYYDEEWDGAELRYIPGNPYLVQIIDVSNDRIWVKFEDDIEACIGKSEFAWPNVGRDVQDFNVGEYINVLVKAIDEKSHRVTASIRELTPDPWLMADESLKGQSIDVKVIGIKEGKLLLVETVDNLRLHGIILFSEISWQFSSIELPMSTIPAVGQIVSARVIVISKALRRLSLSIRQLHPDPWSNLEPGVTVRGKVGPLTSTGTVEVTLENGLKAITNELDLESMGKEYLDFKIVECSRQTKAIEVSHSQLLYDRSNEDVILNFFGA